MKLPADAKLIILATNWGYTGTLDQFCEAAKKEGYEGIEIWWPVTSAAQEELFSALKKHQLEVGFLCGGSQKDFAEHLDTFTKNLEAAVTNSFQKPVYINCHSGRDFFSMEEGFRFIDATTKAHQQSGVPVYHETHRSRLMYTAPVAKQYLLKRPDLMLNADLSHWCNVHETMLEDQEETLQLVLGRCGHIHARIGHPEGPQVNDPRAPEWEKIVQRHLDWWDEIIKNKLKRKENTITILTEFGPPDYMPVLPYTRLPVANQWEINVYMLNLLRKRYSNPGRL
jgi:sugar phosphate isomerase/epimerase